LCISSEDGKDKSYTDRRKGQDWKIYTRHQKIIEISRITKATQELGMVKNHITNLSNTESLPYKF
jgi:hypothetical protein